MCVGGGGRQVCVCVCKVVGNKGGRQRVCVVCVCKGHRQVVAGVCGEMHNRQGKVVGNKVCVGRQG